MSGPPYPHPNPAPGSNAIGSFIIGVSPIGDISTFDVWATVINQYANSPILTGMITAFNEAMDQTGNLDNFFDLIWNVLTAQGYGLDVWGRIVGVVRTLHIPGSTEFLGFEEAGSWTGFGQGGFASGGSALTQNVVLSDTQYRTLILAKAAANISDGSIPAFNAVLLAMFPSRGDVHVADNQDMTLTVTLPFVPTDLDLAMIQTSGALPFPVGVVVDIAHP